MSTTGDSAPQQVHLRLGVEADAAVLAEFAARTFAETFAGGNDPADLTAHLARAFGTAQQASELRDPQTITVLAHRNETLLAFAQVRRSVPPPCVTARDAVELHRFYVDRPAQGRGVAQQLMDEAHRCARALLGSTLWLGVWERNPRALAFYRKCGFVDCGSHAFYLGSDRQIDRVLVTSVRPT